MSESPTHPDVTHMKMRVAHAYALLTHDDPLSANRPVDDIAAAILALNAQADAFFIAAQTLRVNRAMLTTVRSQCDSHYNLDHLRYGQCTEMT